VKFWSARGSEWKCSWRNRFSEDGFRVAEGTSTKGVELDAIITGPSGCVGVPGVAEAQAAVNKTASKIRRRKRRFFIVISSEKL
jgi:hypothetical protein